MTHTAAVTYTVRADTAAIGFYDVTKPIDGVEEVTYVVWVAEGPRTCTCKQWQYRKRMCKHMHMVENRLLQDEGGQA
jgi:hypothetical protein